jgi:hypothetical protein
LGRFDERHRAAIRRDYSEGFRVPHYSRVNIEKTLNGFQAITDKESFLEDNLILAYEHLSQGNIDFGLVDYFAKVTPNPTTHEINSNNNN